MKKLNGNLVNIVNLLRDGQYHDGTSMGATLQMTRSAVWKTIKKLQDYGVQIDSVKGKGYALLTPLRLLERREITRQLSHPNMEINIFESIASTNDYLKSHKKCKGVICCFAEQQTHGKGRLGREWYSPFGKNIYMSCLYPFQKDISELAGLSLITSLAIVRTLNSYSSDDCFSVKWPNDVTYQGKKISGTLIEIQAESHGASHAIIGIGINVNMLGDNVSIAQPWTSLQLVTGKYIDRNELSARLINHLMSYLAAFASYGLVSFKDEWMKADCLTSKVIALQHGNNEVVGQVAGINEQGHLLLQLENGVMHAFSSGDTSVRKWAR